MSRAAEFLPEARQDVIDAVKYYQEQAPGLGDRFRIELETKSEAIASQPLLWRKRSGGYRRVNLTEFPFYIGYFLRGERVLIVVVGHVSRRPGFWKRRMPPGWRDV